jgi:hypothetical protein
MKYSKRARPQPTRSLRSVLRFAGVAALLTQTAGGCFNTEKTCADFGKVPTCNVGAQAGTAGTAGTAGSAGGGAGGTTGDMAGAAGEAGAAGQGGAP